MFLNNGESPTLKKLTSWVARVLIALGDSARGGVKLHIRDPGDYGAKALCREYVLDGEKQADKVALEIEHDAQEEADGAGRGPHHFELFAYKDQDRTPFNTTRFIMVSESGPEETDQNADGRTLLAQTQRHLEAVMKMQATKDAAQMHAMLSLVTAMGDRLQAHESTALQSQQLAHQNTMDRAKIEYDLEMRKFMIECARGIAAVGIPIAVPKLVTKWLEEEKTEEPQSVSTVSETVSAPVAIPAHVEPIATQVAMDTAIVSAPKNGHSKKPRKRS